MFHSVPDTFSAEFDCRVGDKELPRDENLESCSFHAFPCQFDAESNQLFVSHTKYKDYSSEAVVSRLNNSPDNICQRCVANRDIFVMRPTLPAS